MDQYSHSFIDAIHTGNIQIIGFPNAPLFTSNTYVSPIPILPGQILSQTPTGPVGITPIGEGGISVQVTDTQLIISGNASGSSDQILLDNHPNPIQDLGFPVQIYSMGNTGTFIGSFYTLAGKAYLIAIDAVGLTPLNDAIGIQTTFLVRQSSVKKMGQTTITTNPSLQFSTIEISLVGQSINFIASTSAQWTLKLSITSV